MAGSINLSLSQQFDKLNGTLLSGGRLYFYAAGTDSPQNAYKDTNLSLVHPNPIILTSDGRIPQLYFDDGSVHVRLTNSAGVVQFDEDFVLVVGPSDGGGGGGGSSVDANSIFQTGMITWLPTSGERSGWVQSSGLTVGNGSSGAHYNTAEHQALFEHLWNTYSNSLCPVSSGRGPNSLSDWTNNHTIGTIDFRELMTGGMSTMGNTDRGSFSTVPVEYAGRTTAGGIIGEIVHALTTGELAAHTHAGPTDGESVPHTHSYDRPAPNMAGSVGGVAAGGSGGNIWYGGSVSATATGTPSVDHTHSFTTTATGSGTAHNNTPRIMLGTFYMRL